MKKEVIGKYIAILGALLLLALLWSIANTFYSFYSLFQEISLTGIADPKLMAGHISSTLISTVLGLVICFPGMLLLVISVTALNYRPKWVFYLILVT